MSRSARKRIVIIILTILIAIGISGCSITKKIASERRKSVTQTETTEPDLIVPTEKPTEVYEEETYDNTEMTENITTEPDYEYKEEIDEYEPEEEIIEEDEYEEDDNGYSNYGGTYILVNIESQTLWYFENDILILETPVVTGSNYSPTPRGEFEILNKHRQIVLTGENYEAPVEYWMAFLGSSYGLHDASWRTYFGDDIYIYDGSHGCINIPLDNMALLFQQVDIGTPVIIE